jgi:hypothetical protein
MNKYEFDFRYDWVSLTFRALESGFESIRKKAAAESWFDGIWQLEHAESILGIAFVTAQAYILGTAEDANKILESNGKNRKHKIDHYADDPKPLPSGTSRVLLINSIANYYKHHDEWSPWPTNSSTTILANVGIDETSEFPCYEAAKILWDENDIENLDNLMSIISEWRKYILSKVNRPFTPAANAA